MNIISAAQPQNGRLYLLRVRADGAEIRVTLLEGKDTVRHGFADLDAAVTYITKREADTDKRSIQTEAGER